MAVVCLKDSQPSDRCIRLSYIPLFRGAKLHRRYNHRHDRTNAGQPHPRYPFLVSASNSSITFGPVMIIADGGSSRPMSFSTRSIRIAKFPTGSAVGIGNAFGIIFALNAVWASSTSGLLSDIKPPDSVRRCFPGIFDVVRQIIPFRQGCASRQRFAARVPRIFLIADLSRLKCNVVHNPPLSSMAPPEGITIGCYGMAMKPPPQTLKPLSISLFLVAENRETLYCAATSTSEVDALQYVPAQVALDIGCRRLYFIL